MPLILSLPNLVCFIADLTTTSVTTHNKLSVITTKTVIITEVLPSFAGQKVGFALFSVAFDRDKNYFCPFCQIIFSS